MSGAAVLASVRDLCVVYRRGGREVRALRGVSVDLTRGRVTALVGESGSGKSTLGLALVGLLPHNARVERGAVSFEGRELRGEELWREVRGSGIAWQPQDALAALDPLMNVLDAVAEGPRFADGLAPMVAQARARTALERAGFACDDPALLRFPHGLSGGQRLRVAFAAAIAREPRVLIADEPTAALDAPLALRTTGLLRDLAERGSAVLWITHDLALAAHAAHEIAVIYAGRIVEIGAAREVVARPRHPYTALLLAVARSYEPAPAATMRAESGCAFRGRCPLARVSCATSEPELVELAGGRRVACPFHAEVRVP